MIGANLVQQCVRSGLLDEIHLDLVPVLLGDGVRLFDQSAEPIELQSTQVIAGAGVIRVGRPPRSDCKAGRLGRGGSQLR